MTAIQTRGVTKRYRQGEQTVTALDDVDLAIAGGEFVSVMGPSGSGKTTLLNILGLLDGPTEGTVLLEGQDVTDLSDRERTDRRRETIGFVFQHYYLLPTLSALENVTVPRLFTEEAEEFVEDRARDLLERVGLGDRLDHKPSELSGGQKQRVAIARSLINEPRVLLADEPTGNLDRETGARILAEFEAVADSGFAVIAVTHDEMVAEYTDRTIELVDGVRR